MLREDVSAEEGQGIHLSLRAGTCLLLGQAESCHVMGFFGTPTHCSLPPMDSEEMAAAGLSSHHICPAQTSPCALTGAVEQEGDPALKFCSPTSESDLNDPPLYPAHGQSPDWEIVGQCGEKPWLSTATTAPFWDPAKGTSSNPSSSNQTPHVLGDCPEDIH